MAPRFVERVEGIGRGGGMISGAYRYGVRLRPALDLTSKAISAGRDDQMACRRRRRSSSATFSPGGRADRGEINHLRCDQGAGERRSLGFNQ